MSRRPFALIALSLVALSLSACSDTTAPTATAKRQIQPTGQPSNDLCIGGYLESNGRAC
jgi:hypothetical protein